jgi:hypothetical protein
MWNGAYFLLSLPFVGLWWMIRRSWYKAQGKNFWGQTPEEQKREWENFTDFLNY